MKRASIVFLLLLLSAPAFASDKEITTANIVALMNVYRAEAGLPALSEDARLAKAAADRMRDMEEGEYWSHESPTGLSPFTWIALRDYPYRAAAENLAAGFETVQFLVASWMESPGHRENIMSSEYEHCGIAIIDGSTKGPATGKSIVVLFGAERTARLVAKQP